jgi:hypothetical protein
VLKRVVSVHDDVITFAGMKELFGARRVLADGSEGSEVGDNLRSM